MKKKRTLWQTVSGFFADSSPFMTWVGQGATLVVLNLCLLLCCLPVVSAGAALAALYSVLAHRTDHTYDTAFLAFFRAFRRQFKTATLLWLPFLAVIALLLADLRLLLKWGLLNSAAALTPLLLAAAVCCCTLTWLFPVLATTGGRALPALQTAGLLGLRELGRSLLLLALEAVPLVLFFCYARAFMRFWGFWLLLGFALIAALKQALMAPVLRRLTP